MRIAQAVLRVNLSFFLMLFDVFDQEDLCLKVLKEALLLFLAWNQKQKMFLMEEKMFANKICPKSNKIVTKGTKKVRE